ncbi:MAG: type II secretion system protein [Magnetococcales bacterium]|nr:type II secretion system protein [Magnetococcales bacterium]
MCDYQGGNRRGRVTFGQALDNDFQRGFTLIEMVLVMTLLAILAGAGAKAMAGGFDAYLTARTLSPMADRGHIAMRRIMAELQGSSCDSFSQPDGASSLQLTSHQGEQLIFKLSATETDSITMEVNGGGEKLVLPGVSSLDFDLSPFTTETGCLVTINMTLQSTLYGGEVLTLPMRSSLYVYVGQNV